MAGAMTIVPTVTPRAAQAADRTTPSPTLDRSDFAVRTIRLAPAAVVVRTEHSGSGETEQVREDLPNAETDCHHRSSADSRRLHRRAR